MNLNTTEDIRDRFLTMISSNVKVTDWLTLMLSPLHGLLC
jgi:hypothetical protein